MTLILPQRGRLSVGAPSITVSLHSSNSPANDDKPSLPSFAAGDLVVVFRSDCKTSGSDPPSSLTPSGWTALQMTQSMGAYNGNGIRVRILCRIAQAGDTTTPDFAGAVSGDQNQVAMVFRGSSAITAFSSITPVGAAARTSSGAGPITVAASSSGPTVQIVGYSTKKASYTRSPSDQTGEVGPSAATGGQNTHARYWISDGTAASLSAQLSSGASPSAVIGVTLELS